jgi:pyridoxamine 5'-phosphate oxidase
MSAERSRRLLEPDVDPDPLRQFEAWYSEAGEAGIRVPDAMVLATASADGTPSARMVLLKGFDENGFSFFTNYGSRKGRELESNPRAALLFYWDPLGRQVRIEGSVARVEEAESDAYFASRALGSRLSAAVSPQSGVIESRTALERLVADLESRLAGREPDRPQTWGGFRLAPSEYEFWQHHEDRLHDRLRYRRSGVGWLIERLAP